MSDHLCSVCGLPLDIGDQPCIVTIRPHAKTLPQYVFQPYFDVGLGKEITSFAERWTAMRRQGLQYRDLPSKGDMSARRDREAQYKQEAARQER